ncbi:hypothetical protein [Pseudomonas putida]|uniref:hypothetical protein n=1 Tax=Pseudomonas putida TaxID=303 RepID=UPI001E56C4BA|nr:hypothetical protein [Pseudomonas putida]
MRVPVYPEDLLPQAAFKKLAKSIQKRWPGNSPVQLTLARETLSKGLGYANYHDLSKKSVICPRDAETPALGPDCGCDFFGTGLGQRHLSTAQRA